MGIARIATATLLVLAAFVVQAQDPKCVYRYYSGGGGGYCDGCNVGYPSGTTPSFYSQIRQFGFFCQSCSTRCAQIINATPDSSPTTATCNADQGDGTHLRGAALYGVDSLRSNRQFSQLVQHAPEIALVLFSSSVRNGKALQIDQSHNVVTSGIRPDEAFVRAAISGMDEISLQNIPTNPTPAGKHLRVESWSHPIAPGMLEVKYVSSLVSSLDTKDGELLNEVTVYLRKVAGDIGVFQYANLRAERYVVEAIDY